MSAFRPAFRHFARSAFGGIDGPLPILPVNVDVNLTVGSGAGVFGFVDSFIGAITPPTIDGLAVSAMANQNVGAGLLFLSFNSVKTRRGFYYLTLDDRPYRLEWEAGSNAYALRDEPISRAYLQAQVGNTVVANVKSYVPNLLANSTWQGMSGSVGGADFVEPTGWTTGFWPPDEAITVPETGYNALAMQAVANRGFLTITVPSTRLIGQQVNISCFVDTFTSAINQRIVHISSGATEVQRCPIVTGPGRYAGIYEVTGNAVVVRIGAGTTANDDLDLTISRPQLTDGARLRPYTPT